VASLQQKRRQLRSSASKVSTEPDERFTFPATQETKATIEASSQQIVRRLQSSVESSLAPSSSAERALKASSIERSNLQQNVTQLLKQNVHSVDSYSDFSLGSRDIDLRQYDHPVSLKSDLSPGKRRDATNFEKRLQDVWRE
jgi:hypothetical protein